MAYCPLWDNGDGENQIAKIFVCREIEQFQATTGSGSIFLYVILLQCHSKVVLFMFLIHSTLYVARTSTDMPDIIERLIFEVENYPILYKSASSFKCCSLLENVV
jgi:hypothetical protein